MEIIVLLLFCLFLLLCILFDVSILYALSAGLILFLLYGRKQGYGWKELAQMSFAGVKQVKNILITFLLIGVLTALWREAGTIAVIVCYASRLIHPPLFVAMAFLLNCLISFLTGTAFGTAATMGVICMTISSALGISPTLSGGAVLAGSFFGDRCSPVSTSALLVSELTQTSIFQNIKNMLRSALIPFLVSCAVYTLTGIFLAPSGQLPDLEALFSAEFSLHWLALLPAVVLLVLCLFQVHVKIAMTVCILASLPICLWVQHTSVFELPSLMLTGYQAADAQVSSMLSGGGIVSMLKVSAIVCLSSSYSHIFQKTGLLRSAKRGIHVLSVRVTPYAAILLTSILSGVIACNQTLTIMLTHQLCHQEEPDSSRFALHLEDTAVVVSPLIPWSIACAVPLASIGAPTACVLWACFLYLLPLWQFLAEWRQKRKMNMQKRRD